MLLDTDIMIDFLRGYQPAVTWLTGYGSPLGLPGLVAMELIQGCQNLAEQRRVEREVQRFRLCWPTLMDCQRSFQDCAAYHLSHHLGLLDALIAATAVGLAEPLATFNVRHYGMINGLQTIQPY
jgi:hypothetical protein